MRRVAASIRMTAGPEEPLLDVERILDTLERHHVKYLVLGGTAANAYGAQRITKDFDCLPERSLDNLVRLAGAMRELNARLRVAGLTDAEAQRLPVHVDAHQLRQMELSTWRTDAGDFDVLADLPDRRGRHLGYEDLTARAVTIDLAGLPVQVAALDDVIASKEWADRPKDHQALPELRQLRRAQIAGDRELETSRPHEWPEPPGPGPGLDPDLAP